LNHGLAVRVDLRLEGDSVHFGLEFLLRHGHYFALLLFLPRVDRGEELFLGSCILLWLFLHPELPFHSLFLFHTFLHLLAFQFLPLLLDDLAGTLLDGFILLQDALRVGVGKGLFGSETGGFEFSFLLSLFEG
jgi:hypothetical protein